MHYNLLLLQQFKKKQYLGHNGTPIPLCPNCGVKRDSFQKILFKPHFLWLLTTVSIVCL